MTLGLQYKVLERQRFEAGDYSLVPIRFEDRYEIMKWRNEQIFHLRQTKLLTPEDQDKYFNEVVTAGFGDSRPKQILFSYLEGTHCIGYGGLVHINWTDRHAELSFIMDTVLQEHSFAKHWRVYLNIIKAVAFSELSLHKVFVYAFDIRPHLYPILEEEGFFLDARLKEHCYYNGRFVDVVIYSKLAK
jgi:RimJ/RimL family protein N-acetyltransferase